MVSLGFSQTHVVRRGQCGDRLPDAFANLRVESQVAADCEFTDCRESLTVYGDGWRAWNILAEDVCFLDAYRQPKVFACLREPVFEGLQLLLIVTGDCCIVSKQHVMDEDPADLCL